MGLRRVLYEYGNLFRILGARDLVRLLVETCRHAPEIVRSKKLTSVDSGMSLRGRDPLEVRYRGCRVRIVVGRMDRMLREVTAGSVFGTVREMIANDVYLRAFRREMHCRVVLDLGSNRGLFSVLAVVVLGAELVLEVEPRRQYAVAQALLFQANGLQAGQSRRYNQFAGTTAMELADPKNCVSVQTILRENGISRVDFAKIDVEGAEGDLFGEPEWLGTVNNLAMELHPAASDTERALEVLRGSGFEVRLTDQFGRVCAAEQAMFLYGSRSGDLLQDE